MTRTIAMIAVAGIAGSAFGQGFALSASSNSVNVGDVVTITMSFNNGAKVLSGGIFNFNADSEIGSAAAGTWAQPGTFTIGGTPNGASLEGARYLQAPNGNPTNGDVFTYAWTATAEGIVNIDLEGISVLEGDLGGFGGTAVQVAGRTTIEVVPTPASAAVLGLGGLAAARRRR